jgi:hypothetical protein
MKVAKVITTSFLPRTIRPSTELSGNPLGYFSHSQNFTKPEQVIDLLRLTLEIESNVNPGCRTDLIFVNNNCGWNEGKYYLNSINGMKNRYGSIKVVHRENIGRSFGGYNAAVKLFGDEYKYYIFTEDDILINQDHYAAIGIKEFINCKNCGFVAYQSISTQFGLRNREDSLHAHGGVGLTSYDVLKKVIEKYMNLPFSSSPTEQTYFDIIEKGEVAFTNTIYKMGYNLIAIDKKVKLYEFAYDRMRGIEKPRYANQKEKLIYYTKNYLIKFWIIKKLNTYKNKLFYYFKLSK